MATRCGERHGRRLVGEDLRRLRQREKLSGVHAARHEEIPRAFRRRFGEDRGLDFPEAGCVEIAAHGTQHRCARLDPQKFRLAIGQLHRLNRLLDADVRVVQLNLALQRRRFVVTFAHRLQRVGERLLKPAAFHRFALRDRHTVGVETGAGHGLGEIEGLEGDVHGCSSCAARRVQVGKS